MQPIEKYPNGKKYYALILVNDDGNISTFARIKFLLAHINDISIAEATTLVKKDLKYCEYKNSPIAFELTESDIYMWKDNGFDVYWDKDKFIHPCLMNKEIRCRELLDNISEEERDLILKIDKLSKTNTIIDEYFKLKYSSIGMMLG